MSECKDKDFVRRQQNIYKPSEGEHLYNCALLEDTMEEEFIIQVSSYSSQMAEPTIETYTKGEFIETGKTYSNIYIAMEKYRGEYWLLSNDIFNAPMKGGFFLYLYHS